MCVHIYTGGSEDSRKIGGRKARLPVSVKMEPADESQLRPSSPPATPIQPHPPEPMSARVVKQENTQDTETSDYLDTFCSELLASGVHSLSDITNRLRSHQVSTHPPTMLQ